MKKLLGILCLLYSALAFGQGAFVAPQTAFRVVNGYTSPLAGATITVCASATGGVPCSPALVNATFLDLALTESLSNPFPADPDGNYQFAIAPGTYTVSVTASGFAGYSYQITAGGSGGGGGGISGSGSASFFPIFTAPTSIGNSPMQNVTSSNGTNYSFGVGEFWQLDAFGLNWDTGVTGSENILVQNSYAPGANTNAGGIALQGAPATGSACGGGAYLLGGDSNSAGNHAAIYADRACSNGFGAVGANAVVKAGSTSASNPGGNVILWTGFGGFGNGFVQIVGNVPHDGCLNIASGIIGSTGLACGSGSGGGTVTNVITGAGLTGGPCTTTCTISVPNGGITNAMLANSSVTVTARNNLSGGGTVALGGTISLASLDNRIYLNTLSDLGAQCNTAVTTLASTGGVIVLPYTGTAGTAMSTNCTINKNNISVQGYGSRSSVIKCTVAGDCFTLNLTSDFFCIPSGCLGSGAGGTLDQINGGTLQGFSVIGNGATGQNIIHTEDMFAWYMRDLFLDGASESGGICLEVQNVTYFSERNNLDVEFGYGCTTSVELTTNLAASFAYNHLHFGLVPGTGQNGITFFATGGSSGQMALYGGELYINANKNGTSANIINIPSGTALSTTTGVGNLVHSAGEVLHLDVEEQGSGGHIWNVVSNTATLIWEGYTNVLAFVGSDVLNSNLIIGNHNSDVATRPGLSSTNTASNTIVNPFGFWCPNLLSSPGNCYGMVGVSTATGNAVNLGLSYSGSDNPASYGFLAINGYGAALEFFQSRRTSFFRTDYNLGTTLVAGDFTVGAGWGSGAVTAITLATSKDQANVTTITTGSTSLAANPTYILTFHDGTFTQVPACTAIQTGGNDIVEPLTVTSRSATAYTFQWNGTPTTGKTYEITITCSGT